MISIRYQVFFIDSKATDRKDRLSAIQPAFSSPSAVEALIRTMKFENKKYLIIVGTENQIEALLTKIQRLDLTDWMDYDDDKIIESIKHIAQELKMNIKTDLRKDKEDTLVTGDDLVQVVASTRTPYKYSDNPEFKPEYEKYWDAVLDLEVDEKFKTGYKKLISQKVPASVLLATHRLAFKNYCRKININPEAETPSNEVNHLREKIRSYLLAGEKKAVELIKKLEEHVKSEGFIKNSGGHKKQRFYAIDRHKDNRFMFIHLITWNIDLENESTYKDVLDYITGMNLMVRRDKGKIIIDLKGDIYTSIEIKAEDMNTVNIYIIHYLTEQEMFIYTQTDNEMDARRVFQKHAKHWYDTADLPEVKHD